MKNNTDNNKLSYKTLILALLFLYAAAVIIFSLVIRPTVTRVGASVSVSSAVLSSSADVNTNAININTATEEQLMELEGIGEARATAIIKYRDENGDFLSTDEIMNVSGIGSTTYDKIKDKICV